MHVVCAVAFWYVFAVQFKHEEEPFTSLNNPGEQAVQGPPSAPSYPALHKQSVTASLRTSESVLFAHDRQVDCPAVSW
eukprot:3934733-Rhodomonas_salina.2